MHTPEELQQDKDFMSATPADQIRYLSSTDPDFKAAHSDDQAAYLAHVTKQPTGAEAASHGGGITGALDTATDYYSRKLAPVDKAVTEALAPRPTGEVLPTETREVPKAALRNLYGAGKIAEQVVTGLPSAIGHAFGDEATPEEKAKYAEGEKAHGEAPGTETSGLRRIGLGVGRLLGADQAGEALEAWKNPATRPTYEQVLDVAEPALEQGAGTVLGMEAAGKLARIPSRETMPTTTGAIDTGIRGVGKAYQSAIEHAPEAGAVVGGTLGALKGPGGAAYGTYTGGRIGKILQKIAPEGTALAEYNLPTEDRNVQRLDKAAKTADKAVMKAEEDHSIYAASEAGGPIDPEANPAFKKSLEALKKARTAQAEAHYHLQEAKVAATEAAANRTAIEGTAKEITPEAVEAARPEAPAPTDEELKARQEKLMGQMEEKAGVEKPAPAAGNVKVPGQVQPETFPQEPTEAPRVDETTRMRPLGGDKGVLMGRKPLQLGEGTPEAAPAAPEAPKKPLGEILPPEKPAKPGRLGTLKVAEGGKVIDAEEPLQQKIEEGLQGTPKPVAVPPARAFEEVLPKHEEITAEEPKEEAKAEPKKFEEALPKHEEIKEERSPEDLAKVQKLLSDHTDQELIREANRRGIDESQYDFNKRDEKRHRADRERLVNDIMDKMSDEEKDKLAGLANNFDSKDETTWTQAERNNLSRAQRARAIMQEHRGGPKPASGGSQGADEPGTKEAWQHLRETGKTTLDNAPAERGGSEESSEKDRAHFAQAKQELPNGTISEQLLRAQELKTKGALPIPDKPEELQEATTTPFKILGQEKLKPETEAATEPKVNPAPAEPRAPIDRTKVQGGDVAQPHTNYHEASKAEGNPWVRRSADPANDAMPTNEKRTLMVQFASDLLQKEAMNDDAKAYYDKLYSGAREGYARMRDFWETPQWMGFASHMLPDADVYVVRDMEQAKNFLNSSKYGNVLFSALDVNAPFISKLAEGYDGNFDVGGYTKPESFADAKNITWHNSMEDFAKAKGIEYKNGVDYRHFEGSDVIPRLTLSDGCLHKCAFCIVEKAIKETPSDVVNQQADAIANMKSKLVYLNDKTFGQAPNYKTLPDLYEKMKAKNPDFQGFVVQTTAAQMNKLTPEFLKKSGIKFAEIGVETYNDALLKEMHKPATESLIDKAMQKLKDADIAAIPNIIIGMPGEDASTYAHTLSFLKKNADAISHANIYNLALYKDSELGQKLALGASEASDFDENVLHKSFHTDPQIHATFAGDLYDLGQKLLDKKVGEPLGAAKALEGESDAEMARRGAEVPKVEEKGGFAPVSNEEYFKAVKENSQTATLTAPEDMKNNTAYKSPEGVYYSLDPKGDIQAVVNNSPSVWNLVSAIQDAVSKGGKTLDAWDLVLPKFYESIGFENTEHVPYDEKAYGPPSEELKAAWKVQGWKEDQPYPGVQHMKVSDEMLAEHGPERVEAARGKGTIPAAKTGLLKFGEPEDANTSFNPEEFQTRSSEVKVTPLSERPNKTILSVKVDGERAGQMSLTPMPELGKDAMEVSTSQLGKAFRGQGHGSEMYKQAIDYAKSKGVKTLYSDDQVTTKADNVWQSLVRKGTAKWDSTTKRYKISISPLGKIGT